jgi:hypothetical protein
MPKIEMMSGMAADISNRMLRLNDDVLNGNTPSSMLGFSASTIGLLQGRANGGFAEHAGIDYGCGFISFLIMKGAVPTAANYNLFNDRSSDILCEFNPRTNNGGGHFRTSQTGANPAMISTEYTNAKASGVATWFWWLVLYGTPNGNGVDLSQPIINQIVGTVGTVGSGADLEVASTNIVIGEPQRVTNFRLQFPTSWEY